MTVEQRPIHRPASAESAFNESQYAAFAAAQFRILKEYMHLARLNTFSRVVTLANGVVITCTKSFNREDIFISVPVLPFTDEITKIEMGLFVFNNKSYPKMSLLYDLNNTDESEFTKNREWDAGDVWASALGTEATTYGNTDWKGFGDTVLCWKGVSSRHFEVDPYKAVPNYMVFDEEITMYDSNGLPYDVSVYTPFSPVIYAHGTALDTVPGGGYTTSKVLGCAYLKAGDKQFLVAVVGMNYRGMANPSSTPEVPSNGGFFTEVYIKDKTWKRLGYERGSRHIANWFFNQSGNEAQCVTYGVIKKINITATSCAFSERPQCTGSFQEAKTSTNTPYVIGTTPPATIYGQFGDPSDYTTKDGDKMNGAATTASITVSVTEDCIVAVDYRGDIEIVATANYEHSDKSLYNTDKYDIAGWLDVFNYEPAADMTLTLTGPTVYTSPADYYISGGCTPITMTYPKSTDCGMGTVSAVDSKGQTASMSVQLPAGTWCLISTERWKGPPGYYAYNNVYASWTETVISGNTRTYSSGFFVFPFVAGSGCDSTVDATAQGGPANAKFYGLGYIRSSGLPYEYQPPASIVGIATTNAAYTYDRYAPADGCTYCASWQGPCPSHGPFYPQKYRTYQTVEQWKCTC